MITPIAASRATHHQSYAVIAPSPAATATAGRDTAFGGCRRSCRPARPTAARRSSPKSPAFQRACTSTRRAGQQAPAPRRESEPPAVRRNGLSGTPTVSTAPALGLGCAPGTVAVTGSSLSLVEAGRPQPRDGGSPCTEPDNAIVTRSRCHASPNPGDLQPQRRAPGDIRRSSGRRSHRHQEQHSSPDRRDSSSGLIGAASNDCRSPWRCEHLTAARRALASDELRQRGVRAGEHTARAGEGRAAGIARASVDGVELHMRRDVGVCSIGYTTS